MNDTLTLAELFRGKILQVPDYQRGYAWGKEQWEDLIEDLEYLAPTKEHFTGTVILHPQSGESLMDFEGTEHHVFHVVDGQQRLTTLTLLLDAISRAIKADDERLAEGIRKNYIASRDRMKQPFFKLRLNKDCHAFFSNDVLGESPSLAGERMRSHEQLAGARDFFDRYITRQKESGGSTFGAWLEELHRKVTQKLRFLQYVVSSQSEVGVIFEVTNDRGKPLSELEKVKNYLLYLANKIEGQHDLADVINSTWTEIFERLMESGLASMEDENRLLRAHWLMAYDYETKSWEGAKSIKHRFSLKEYQGRHPDMLAALLDYTRVLRDCLIAYCDTYNPEHPQAFLTFDPKERIAAAHWGQKLHRIGNIASYVPLLIATRLRYRGDGTRYIALLQFCERASFRVYRWAERRSNAGQSKLFRLAHELYHGGKTFEQVELEARGIALAYCSNADFEKGTIFDGGSWYGWSGLRYFLYEYEEHLAGKQGPRVAWKFFASKDLSETIEHILPQTPDDTYWSQRFTDEQIRQYLHDLGNLCLTYDNSSYSNKAFPAKKGAAGAAKPCYATSKLFMEQELAGIEEWNENSVLGRRKSLMAWAVQRWAMDDRGIGVDPTDGEEESETEDAL